MIVRWPWVRHRDRILFLTHTPGGRFGPGGTYVDDAGLTWVITRIVETSPTRLLDGGSHPCWVVYGRRT